MTNPHRLTDLDLAILRGLKIPADYDETAADRTNRQDAVTPLVFQQLRFLKPADKLLGGDNA